MMFSYAMLITCSFTLLIILSHCGCDATCSSGRFGGECQYLCHCKASDDCDDVTGACPNEECDSSWFGPACQYVSSTYDGPRWLDDGSCNDGEETVTVSLDDPQPLTWIRVVVSDTVKPGDIEVSYDTDGSADGTDTLSPCPQDQSAIVSETTLDISCPTSGSVSSITLTGPGVSRMCALFISGERNVALKGPTYTVNQSSTYEPDSGNWGAANAIDNDIPPAGSGKAKLEVGCSQTTGVYQGFYQTSWELDFGIRSFNVYKFLIYGRRDSNSVRLIGFRLDVYGGNKALFNYTDTNTVAQGENSVYSIVPSTRIDSAVSRVTVRIPGSEYPLNLNILELCEVLIYGDSVCENGKYGRECEKQCNCAGQGTCFVSTGGCPSGCASGFTGEDCKTRE